MALEQWQIKALENDLIDYNAWASHAVASGIFPSAEAALESKANKCAKRMVGNVADIPSAVLAKASEPGYKNRVQRNAEEFI